MTRCVCGDSYVNLNGYCSELCTLRAALAPFAEMARRHGVRASKDDLWVSLGLPGSAWLKAIEAMK